VLALFSTAVGHPPRWTHLEFRYNLNSSRIIMATIHNDINTEKTIGQHPALRSKRTAPAQRASSCRTLWARNWNSSIWNSSTRVSSVEGPDRLSITSDAIKSGNVNRKYVL